MCSPFLYNKGIIEEVGRMAKGLELGITKIGDLLINGKFTQLGKEKDKPFGKLTIPYYQRPYKWEAKNANQLMDDIMDAMKSNKENYRVGTLILHKENDFYNIVDGQQRTITFSLLLKCLEPNVSIPFLGEEMAENTHNLFNIINNYRALRRRVENLLKDESKSFSEYVKKNCEMIVVITDDISEAFQFFDSQNARGKALYPHDLLKAYHLREMDSLDAYETEKIVKMWEDLDQKTLAKLFNDYLYRLKEWIKGNRPTELTEHNIDIFKGVNSNDSHPYAKFYKGAYAYADELNKSYVGFVVGMQEISPFQVDTPIIAGKPFFEYAKHYYDILSDIKNNDKYEGYYINDNRIVRTLDQTEYQNGTGNKVTRLMFDTAVLLYVDRFCPAKPTPEDTSFLEQFVNFAFIWAYSMRAQYVNVGWLVAQNYIAGTPSKSGIKNSFNIYKIISESDSPSILLGKMADMLIPIKKIINDSDVDDKNEETDTYKNYLHFFKELKYITT